MNSIISQKDGHSGAEWIKTALGITPSPLGANVADLLSIVFRGIYHLETRLLKEVEWTNHDFLELRHPVELATYDFDLLTVLVVVAHDLAIRVSIEPRSREYLLLQFHPRTRAGGMGIRHPTLEQAVKDIRQRYAVKEESFE